MKTIYIIVIVSILASLYVILEAIGIVLCIHVFLDWMQERKEK